MKKARVNYLDRIGNFTTLKNWLKIPLREKIRHRSREATKDIARELDNYLTVNNEEGD